MNGFDRQSWIVTTILVGALYSTIGVVLAIPSHHVRFWRLAAWGAGAVVYAAHIGYEHFTMRNPPLRSSLHVAMAAAIGGFGLAAAAMVHSLINPPNYPRSRFHLALVVWPLVTGVPAFLVALPVISVIAFLRSSGKPD